MLVLSALCQAIAVLPIVGGTLNLTDWGQVSQMLQGNTSHANYTVPPRSSLTQARFQAESVTSDQPPIELLIELLMARCYATMVKVTVRFHLKSHVHTAKQCCARMYLAVSKTEQGIQCVTKCTDNMGSPRSPVTVPARSGQAMRNPSSIKKLSFQPKPHTNQQPWFCCKDSSSEPIVGHCARAPQPTPLLPALGHKTASVPAAGLFSTSGPILPTAPQHYKTAPGPLLLPKIKEHCPLDCPFPLLHCKFLATLPETVCWLPPMAAAAAVVNICTTAH
jgi:hypothetical protein